ncbi:calcium-binding protein [Salipiger mangrovisoli]|uniref:calcium-binding protein n=1 Tax=Salipiger mangrovisoli TaxID=2865933 RepID=UPI00187EE15C
MKITTDGVTIEGDAAGGTVITLDDSMAGDPAFQVGENLFEEELGTELAVSAASKGADSLTLAKANHGLQVGDVIWITMPNDDALYDDIGDTAWQKDSKDLRTQMVTVTSVDGRKIGFDNELDFDFDRSATVQRVHTVDDVTIQNLFLEGDYGSSDPTDFSNTISAEDDGMMILVNTSSGFSLSNVSMHEAGSSGLVIAKSVDADIDGLTVEGSHNKGSDGNGYGVWIRDVYDSSFSDLTIMDTRHAVLFASYTSASGNDVHVTYTNRDINFHGGLDTGNTVTVNNSIRDTEAEQRSLGLTYFVNDGGKSYGAPTDRDANTVLFTNVQGTVRAEEIELSDAGGVAYTYGSADTVTGGAGDDWIDMGTGADVIYASGGNDTLIGDSGTDTVILDGSIDDISVSSKGARVLITHSDGSMLLDGVEVLQLGGKSYSLADKLDWLIGNGGWSEDRADDHASVDDEVPEEGSESLPADEDAAEGEGQSPSDGSGDTDSDKEAVDEPVGAPDEGAVAVFTGTSSRDTLVLSGAATEVDAQSGSDTVTGGAGDDYVVLGSGHDRFEAAAGNDSVFGGYGNDTVSVGPDLGPISVSETSAGILLEYDTGSLLIDDRVEFIELGGKEYRVSNDLDSLITASGSETGASSESGAQLSGPSTDGDGEAIESSPTKGAERPEAPTEVPTSDLTGTGKAERLVANGDQTVVFALGGDDTVSASNVSTWIDLGAGDDRGLGRNGADTLLGGEGADNLRGNNGDDYLLGGSGNDTIYGNAGNDTVVGGDGDDKLNGGSGDNTLEGGGGSDKFVIIEGKNVITDFDAGEGDAFYFENQSDSQILESLYRWFETGESATGFRFSVSDGGLTVTAEAGSLFLEDVTVDYVADWYELG